MLHVQPAFSCHRCVLAGHKRVIVKLSSAHKSLLVSFTGGTGLLGVSVSEKFF